MNVASTDVEFMQGVCLAVIDSVSSGGYAIGVDLGDSAGVIGAAWIGKQG